MAWNNDSSTLVWTQPPPMEGRAFARTPLAEVCQFSHSISSPQHSPTWWPQSKIKVRFPPKECKVPHTALLVVLEQEELTRAWRS